MLLNKFLIILINKYISLWLFFQFLIRFDLNEITITHLFIIVKIFILMITFIWQLLRQNIKLLSNLQLLISILNQFTRWPIILISLLKELIDRIHLILQKFALNWFRTAIIFDYMINLLDASHIIIRHFPKLKK